MTNELKKSEILFLYETMYNIPNGDPFTGEQRYDEETKKILVSDVRMKRYVRDYLDNKNDQIIYIKQKSKNVQESNEDTSESETNKEDSNATKKGSGSARRIDELILQFKGEIEKAKKELESQEKDENNIEELSQERKKKNKPSPKFNEALFVMKKCIDVRLFGGISTKKENAVNLTGPVQFSLLNSSLNKVDLRPHQNTSCFESKQGNKQGAIGTTSVVPYSLVQIHGWVNPKVAEITEMSNNDLNLMYEGLWFGTSGEGSSHSRSKIGQSSILLLEIEYSQPNQKIYGLDRLIKIEPKENKKDEQIRNIGDYSFNFEELITVANSDKVSKILYYTELEEIKKELTGNKFKEMSFTKTKEAK